jgi:hypothetical protein
MELKEIPEKYYAPMFVYVKPFILMIIFSSYGIFLFTTSFVSGKYQQNLSRSLTLRIGIFLHVLACGCFISLEYT